MRTKRFFAVLGVSALFCAGVPLFGDTATGLEAFRNGDYQKAFREWKACAETGKADAQFDLGMLYAKGLGVQRDMTEAVRWYRSAAEKGNVQAAFSLGQLYSRGWGVPRDEADAMRWLEMANSTDPDQQQVTGWAQVAGYGMPQDFVQAAYWYRQAADHGHAEAQFNLARLYAHGQGVPRDDSEAARWCRAAATHGFAPAQERLAVRYAQGSGLPQDNSQAFFWATIAMNNGDKHAGKLRNELKARLTPSEAGRLEQSAVAWQQSRTSLAKR
ncbi:Sel1 domain protein repeat-containing protein [Candidatus Sulfopaludibacter sp. SbA3]|nr:Sel1 domain protein repeat-containing protein [Candidatus Sulfopaludibacter sp. SbA3]